MFTGCSPSNQSWSYFGMITKGHHSQLQNMAYQNQYSSFGHSEFLIRSCSKSSVTIAQWVDNYPFFYHYLALVYYLIPILFTPTAYITSLGPIKLHNLSCSYLLTCICMTQNSYYFCCDCILQVSWLFTSKINSCVPCQFWGGLIHIIHKLWTV